jgi:predicted nucleic acid-binding Zn ribbon protein
MLSTSRFRAPRLERMLARQRRQMLSDFAVAALVTVGFVLSLLAV